MSRTPTRAHHPASPRDVFTTLCGRQVKVKKTFLDEVVREQSSNESTLEAQTCPEFRSRNDALSSSSASISGSATASATQSELCLGTDPELMHTLQSLPNTLQTLSPLCSLRYQVAEVPACEADFTDNVPPNTMPMTLELWPDQMSREAQLLSALQAVPNVNTTPYVPYRHFLNAPNAQSPPRIHDALGANLTAMAVATAFPSMMTMPNVPSVPWAPPVLSTIPPANEILAQVGQMEATQCDPEPAQDRQDRQDGKAFGESQTQKPQEACEAEALGALEALEAYEVEGKEGKEGKDVRDTEKEKKKKKHVSKVWSHFYLEPSMLPSGFDVNKKIIGHGGANTKRIFEKTGAKIRLRGRGSGHNEGERGEAPVPLMLAVTSDTRNQENFLHACELSSQLLQTVTSKYPDFCKHHGHSTVIPAPLFWIGDASQDALASFEYVNESQVRIGKIEVTLSLDAGVAGGLPRGSRRGY